MTRHPASTPSDSRVARAAETLRALGVTDPDVAVVLGSGLSSFAEGVEEPVVVPYGRIPGFPATAVRGHRGAVHAGRVSGKRALVLSGRVHCYEGYTHSEVTFGVRLAAALGAPVLVITNAAGSVDPAFDVGDVMLIADQISLVTGPRRPPGPAPFRVAGAYSPALRALAREAALDLGVRLREGVYLGSLGPTYETPAEIGLARAMGANAVGMSTVAEVQAAAARGLDVLGLSLVANVALPGRHEETTHAEVLAAGEAGAGVMLSLVRAVLDRLHS
jgi:purine-nucleoside phosphorylase